MNPNLKKLVHSAAFAAAFLLFALPGSPGAALAPTVGGEAMAYGPASCADGEVWDPDSSACVMTVTAPSGGNAGAGNNTGYSGRYSSGAGTSYRSGGGSGGSGGGSGHPLGDEYPWEPDTDGDGRIDAGDACPNNPDLLCVQSPLPWEPPQNCQQMATEYSANSLLLGLAGLFTMGTPPVAAFAGTLSLVYGGGECSWIPSAKT